jgi:AraC-like DNA-binding protein
MQRQSLDDLVDGIPRTVHGQPGQGQIVGGHVADGRPVGLVVPGLEHLLDVNGGGKPAADGQAAHLGQGRRVRGEDEHRLAEHRQVGVARAVLVRFTYHPGDPAGHRDKTLEAMHAHFERHIYHRHSHDTYSLGVTDTGAQSFICRRSAHTSAAGMVMAFNPDDPHDGRATGQLGFTYRMIHIGPEVVSGVLDDAAGQPVGPPLFAEPVVSDPVLAAKVRGLHGALLGGATSLRRDEMLADTIRTAVRQAATRPGAPALTAASTTAADARRVARRARDLIASRYLEDMTTDDLAAVTGRSRFTVHRAFTHLYGMAPSDYQRQLRLRAARSLIAEGRPISEAAVEAGFADQSHLSRWFTRCYGVTPGRYQRAISAQRGSFCMPGRA